MTLSSLAYRQGSQDALQKFAAVPAAGAPGSIAPPMPPSITATGGAPNMAPAQTAIKPVTGLPATPSAAAAGKTNAQAAVATGTPPAAAASPVAAPAAGKTAALFAPSAPPKSKATSIAKGTSPVGSNVTTETVKSAPAGTASPTTGTPPAATANVTGAAAPLTGGIIPSTGSPAATLANETASHARGETVSRSGGLK